MVSPPTNHAQDVQSAHPRQRYSPVGRTFWVVSFIISLLIAWKDPFGVGTRTKDALQAAFDRVVAAGYKPAEAHRIALITENLSDVANGRAHIPIFYSELAQIVDLARVAHARAIFLDYKFNLTPAAGDNVADLIAAARQADAAGTAVLTGPIGSNPVLSGLRGVVQEVAVDQTVGHPLDYVLVHQDPQSARTLSAAAALYLLACSGPEPLPKSECDQNLLRRLREGPTPPTLAMQYGAAFPEEETPYIELADRDRCRVRSLGSAIASGLAGAPQGAPCPNHLTISASMALDDDYTDQLKTALDGRLLIVGSGPDLGDDHDWPGVGRVPGALVHANALDNLLTDGASYRRWPSPVLGQMALDDLVGILMVFVSPLLVLAAVSGLPHVLHQRRTTQESGRWKAVFIDGSTLLLHRLRRSGSHASPTVDDDGTRRVLAYATLGVWLAAAVLPFLVALLFFCWLRWAPACALEILAIGLPLTTALCGEELAQKLQPLDTWSAGANLALAAAAVVAALAAPWALALPIIDLCLALVIVRIGYSIARTARRHRRRRSGREQPPLLDSAKESP